MFPYDIALFNCQIASQPCFEDFHKVLILPLSYVIYVALYITFIG